MKQTTFIERIKNIGDINYKQIHYHIAIRKGEEPRLDFTEVGNFRGIPIYQSNVGMEMMGAIIATYNQVLFSNFIMIDSHFEKLSTDTARFVLLHEVGHARDPNLLLLPPQEKNKLRKETIKKGEVLAEERFADDYAVNEMGAEAGVRALQELRLVSSSYRFWGKDPEMDLRIQRVMELSKQGC